ncbi:MAG: hypothetical protein KatS3mg102_2127 [Planctomycetota bacterium]|nr:MAG: hypothetical protein KatS3mg102_2127 [Planctomycetota bacterium]
MSGPTDTARGPVRPARALVPLALLLSLQAVAGCGAQREPYRSGPYLQQVTAHSAIVALVDTAPRRLAVEYAPLAASPESSWPAAARTAEAEPTRLHALQLTGLEPDTVYRYRVLELERERQLAAAWFRTAPLPASRPVRFAVFGDSGRSERVTEALGPLSPVADSLSGAFWPGEQHRVAALLARELLDFCLHTGDVVYPTGARRDYGPAFFRPFAGLIATTPLYPVLGNHDVMSEDGAPWLEVFVTPANNAEGSERYYSFECGDVHVACLDVVSSHALERDSPQLAWLIEDLEAAQQAAWRVCVLHYPPFDDGVKGDTGRVQRMLVPIFTALGVDVVFAGHDHAYERFYPIDGVLYIVTGGGGNSVYPLRASRAAYAEPVFHAVLGEADRDRMTLRAVDLAGHTFDAVTLYRGDRF